MWVSETLAPPLRLPPSLSSSLRLSVYVCVSVSVSIASAPPFQFIQCFGCLNVTAMVSIIVYVIVNNVDLGGDSEDPPPDPSA